MSFEFRVSGFEMSERSISVPRAICISTLDTQNPKPETRPMVKP